MSFLPDVVTPCEACGGARFEPPTLEVRYHGLTIGDVLALSADEAPRCFAAHPQDRRAARELSRPGRGLPAARPGLATRSRAARRSGSSSPPSSPPATRHEPTLYVLDEPTTGLHLGDVAQAHRRARPPGGARRHAGRHRAPPDGHRRGGLRRRARAGGRRRAAGASWPTGTPREVARLKTATGRVLKSVFSDEAPPRKVARGR